MTLFLVSEYLPPVNEVCEGYVFTGVCLSTGGGHACMGGVHGGGACVAGGCAWWGHAWRGRAWWWGVRGRRDGYCNGRYASYWNAFLLRTIVLVFIIGVNKKYSFFSASAVNICDMDVVYHRYCCSVCCCETYQSSSASHVRYKRSG